MNNIVLFADIDGVFNNAKADAKKSILNKRSVFPIPLAISLLRAINNNTMISPVWLSHWGESSIAWNRYSATRKWPIAFPLSSEEQIKAKQLYPMYDDKVLAIMWYLHQHTYTQSVWIQDSFPTVDPKWAEKYDVSLLDTTQSPLKDILMSKHINPLSAVQHVIQMIIDGTSNDDMVKED